MTTAKVINFQIRQPDVTALVTQPLSDLPYRFHSAGVLGSMDILGCPSWSSIRKQSQGLKQLTTDTGKNLNNDKEKYLTEGGTL